MPIIQTAAVLLAFIAAAGDEGAASSSEWERGSIDRAGLMYSGGQVVSIRVWNPRQISTLARDADVLQDATHLRFDFSGTTDKEFAALPTLPSVEFVHIFEEEALGDESLRVLASFPKLTDLYLEGTAITGKGFRYFAMEQDKKPGGPPLHALLIGHNKLTDEGLRQLAKISTLETLWIRESGITAQGALEHLPKLKRLFHLTINYSASTGWITVEERRQLAAKMPRCEVGFGVYRGEQRRLRYAIGTGNRFLVPEEEGKERSN